MLSRASASSEPLSRLFINSLLPSMTENSVPRLFSRSVSRPPGTGAVSSVSHGIIAATPAGSATPRSCPKNCEFGSRHAGDAVVCHLDSDLVAGCF
jgi:hypothetical protein